MIQECEICDKETDFLRHNGRLISNDGTDADVFLCAECLAAPALASKYRKALEEVLSYAKWLSSEFPEFNDLTTNRYIEIAEAALKEGG